MATSPSEIPARLKPLANELLDNSYARDNLREGAEKLHDAYERARKRRVHPSKDRKLRKQIESALHAIDEGTSALASGRRKPSHKGRNAFIALLVAVFAGTAAVLATNKGLRESVFGSAEALKDEAIGADES